jgi:hypothetical protein
MRRGIHNRESKPLAELDTDAVPHLALTHGQTVRLLTELGLHHGVSDSTFNYYIKSLRKLGVPFEKGKGQAEGHRHVTYDFDELMELTVALLLRVYGTLPDTIIAGLRNFRDELRPIYRQAYFDLTQRTNPAARISELGGNRIVVDDLFLDLNIRYSAGQMIEFGPPKAISPFEALTVFARAEVPARSYLPLNVSAVAEMIVGRARALPSIRRGRGAPKVPRS